MADGFFDNLLGIVKRGALGGLLQDDNELLNTYLPQSLQQGLSDEDRQRFAAQTRNIVSTGLLSRGVDSTERAKQVQTALFGELSQRQAAKQQEQLASLNTAAQDYVQRATAPTVTPEMALSAQDIPAGPTVQRAGLVGMENPNRMTSGKANAEALRMVAQKIAVTNPAQAKQYIEMANSLDSAPETKVVGNALVRPDGSVVYSGEQKQPSAVQEYEYARQQGFKGTFEQFKMAMANAGAPKVAVNTADPTALAKAGLDLQDKVRSAFKADEQIAGQFGVMQNAVKNPSAQGDTSLLYSFFKVLDPESTVREGELNLVMSSRSIPEKLKGYAQRLATGQTLTQNERLDLLTQAQRQVESRMSRVEKERKAYSENARRLTLDPDVYVPDPYASLKGSAQPSGNGGSKRMVFNPATGRLE